MIKQITTGYFSTNTYLYNYRGDKVIIVDPGNDAPSIADEIIRNSWTPVMIVLTHGHMDHTGAVLELKKRYSIPVALHREDRFFMGHESKTNMKEMYADMGPEADFMIDMLWSETPDPDILLEEGALPGDSGLKVIHTPGHSPGSICLYSENEEILFSGDTLFCRGLGRTDLKGGSYPVLIESLKKLMSLKGETKVYPGHGPSTDIAAERVHYT